MAGKPGASFAFNFSRIIRQANAHREILSPHVHKVTIPGGFPYEAYNGKAFITPWSLIRMVECSRAAVFNTPEVEVHKSFLDVAKIYLNYFMFNVSTYMKIEPELYDHSLPKGSVDLKVALDYVGNTTYKLKTLIYVDGLTKPVCENHTQTVFVDNKTRKPMPPPDWWKEKYAKFVENGEPLKLERLENVPQAEKSSPYEFTVPASDVDPYLHANWSNFIRYYSDAYVHSHLKSSGMKGVQAASERNIGQFSISYIREANIGDQLKVHFWKNRDNKNLYHFQLMNGSNITSECNVEFCS